MHRTMCRSRTDYVKLSGGPAALNELQTTAMDPTREKRQD
jgi:hypothetical protein